MPIDPRFKVTGQGLKRDVRPWTVRTVAALRNPEYYAIINIVLGLHLVAPPGLQIQGIRATSLNLEWTWAIVDIILIVAYFYHRWFRKQLIELPFKLPQHADKLKDKNNPNPANGKPGKPEGILFLGNVKDGPYKNDELWLTNSDARTHMLFLGTTGAGKTEGLKSLISNAFCWSSGFVYVDGKAQNTLWGDVYSLARRFGRDDDVLVLNYMTGNSDNSSRSNSLNPFSIGSASYLTQMMVGLMDDSGDDGGMWKGRAISLMSALMPALTWRRDNQGLMLDVGVIRDNLTMQQIIKMSRDPALPDRVIRGLQSYLDTLPGYVDNAFDDDGNERPPDPNQPMVDLSQTRQQHGYLTMQFTRALSSLADEYGYIFKQQMADIDMMDVVLNRRILVVLIPALEKSPDEAANLGKIVVAALKGMMGATLGAELEGEQSAIIDNNPTTSSTPFMTVFDEVGYYTSPGMGVMAAQARSLGFSLIFAGQDMPALQKRVKEEALSIAGNCNLKIFGKLEDPTETKDFFEKTVSSALVSEASGFSATQGVGGRSYHEGDSITFQARKEASYDDLRRQTQGQVHFLWADKTIAANMFYSNPKRVNVVRVQRMIGVSPRNWAVEARDRAIGEVTAHLRDENWMAGNGAPAPVSPELSEILDIAAKMREAASEKEPAQVAALAVGQLMAVGKKRLTEAVSVPGVGTTAQQGHWPFGGAGDVAQIPGTAAPPPGAPSSPPPPWLATPPNAGGAAGMPGGNASSSAGAGGMSWGNIMGAAPGMGTPPGGAQMVQVGPVAAPPAWMLPPAGGAAASGATRQPPVYPGAVPQPPYAQQGAQQPPYMQPPPYAQPPAGMPAQPQGQQPPYMQPPPYAQPPAMPGMPPQGQVPPYMQPPPAGMPAQPQGQPPYMLPPAQTSNAAPPPSWAQQPPAVQAPPQPVYPVAPPPPPVSAPTRTQDEIDREQAMLNEMLRHAADELSGEMHAQDPDAKPSSEGQDPYKSAEDDGTSSTR